MEFLLRDLGATQVTVMTQREFGPITSPSLLLRIRDPSDSDSWQEFESVYAPIIKEYCLRRSIQDSDTEDIAQEVMTAVANAILSFEYQPERGKFRSWLAVITANKLKSFIAKKGIYDNKLQDIAERLGSSPESDSHWSTVFLDQVFQAAQQRTRPHFEDMTWNCFHAVWIENRNPTEVAKALQIPLHSVYVNKSRVLKRMEQEFLMLSDDFPLVEPVRPETNDD